MHGRIEAFLIYFRQFLADMQDTTLNQFIDSLITKKLEKDRSLHARASRIFTEIVSQTNCWNRREAQVEELRKTTKEELLKMYDEFIMPGAPRRRKLTSMIVGKEAMDKAKEAVHKGAYAALSHETASTLVTRHGPCSSTLCLDEGEEDVVGAGGKTVGLGAFADSLDRFPPVR